MASEKKIVIYKDDVEWLPDDITSANQDIMLSEKGKKRLAYLFDEIAEQAEWRYPDICASNGHINFYPGLDPILVITVCPPRYESKSEVPMEIDGILQDLVYIAATDFWRDGDLYECETFPVDIQI